jgi:hypothetical protein
VSRFENGDALKLKEASFAAAKSSSIASMYKFGCSCATINAITPDPVPISKPDDAFGNEIKLPNTNASVPTFMAESACLTENC